MANPRGIPTLASALIRPTARPDPEPAEADTDPGDDQAEAEGQGGATERKPRRTRTRRPAPGGETKGRKLSLPDGVYDRLQLLAIQRRATVSAVASEILDRNLPRLRIERD